MNIDWIEGATHYGIGDDCPVFFRNIIKGESYEFKNVYSSGIMANWMKCTGYIDIPNGLVERPKKQEAWCGEGLPPVNCFCETLDEDADCWVKVEIYAHTEFMGEAHACAKNGTDMFYGLAHEFRAIKTPEQLAAEERERTRNIGVAQMMEHIHFSLPKELWGECEPACYALYEAGYRKQ